MPVMNRAYVRLLRERIDEALRPLAEQEGIQISAGSASFTDSSCRIRLEIATIAEDGTVESPQFTALKNYARLVGLPEDCAGRTFLFRGKAYRLDGYNVRARRTPCLATAVDSGRRYRFALDAVQRAFRTEE